MGKLPPLIAVLLASSTAGTLAAAGNGVSTNAPAANPPARDAEPKDVDTIIIEGLNGESEMVQSLDEGITFYRRGVVVRYRDMELVATQVAFSENTGDIIADGSVRFRDERRAWTGEHLEYNYKTGLMKGENFSAGFSPYFFFFFQFDGDINAQTSTADDAFLTTDDVKNPSFRVRAKQFRVTAGKSVEAKNATIYLGNTPVFVLPYYKRTFTQHAAFWRVTPG